MAFRAASAGGRGTCNGRVPALGTNPIAFALPGSPDPVVFDMGTSATNNGDVVLAARLVLRL